MVSNVVHRKRGRFPKPLLHLQVPLLPERRVDGASDGGEGRWREGHSQRCQRRLNLRVGLPPGETSIKGIRRGCPCCGRTTRGCVVCEGAACRLNSKPHCHRWVGEQIID